MNSERPQLLVSSCLLGEKVRFNGGHCRDSWLMDRLGTQVVLKGFCPELMMGMSVPRPALRLTHQGNGTSPTLVTAIEGKDLSDKVSGVQAELSKNSDICDGLVMKARSPSCGPERVKYYNRSNGIPDSQGPGVFIESLRTAHPTVPVIDDGRLANDKLKENFVIALYAHFRWRQCSSVQQLQEFHARYKYLLMAYDQGLMRQMGACAAAKEDFEVMKLRYGNLMKKIFERPIRLGPAMNALTHVYGHFKHALKAPQREHLRRIMHGFAEGKLPIAGVLQVMKFLAESHLEGKNANYILQQTLFIPYPEMLIEWSDPMIAL